MEEHLNLVPIALLLIGTFVSGLLLAALRQPPLVGYILAGAVFGPSGLGLIADRKIIDTFAELGVLVLLFVVGTHLSLRAFKNIYRTAIGAALIQILVSVALMLLLTQLFGWQYQRAIFYGFVLALTDAVNELMADSEKTVADSCIRAKELEIELKVATAERQHAEAIIYSISDAVLVTDPFDDLVLANEAAAVGVSHAGKGQVIYAFVVPASAGGVDVFALRKRCLDQLPGCAVPRRIAVLERLPRNPTGKILRRELASLADSGPTG